MDIHIDADAAKLAGLQIDLLQKMRQGHITLDHLEWFTGLSRNARNSFMSTASTCSWREEDGVIYFSVKSDGTTGEDWIKRLEGNGFRIGDYAKPVLRSPDFKPTSSDSTEVAGLKGSLFEDQSRITKKIRAEANRRKLSKPKAELSCLIREKFTDKEIEAMGLWYIVVMHEPIIGDAYGESYFLNANRSEDGCLLAACSSWPVHRWDRDSGLAFAVS